MFDLAPVSLWLEDYSQLRDLFGRWRFEGVTDLRAHLRGDVENVRRCSRSMRVLKVNRRTLALFEARNLGHLVENLASVFRDDMMATYVDELVCLWDGRLDFASRTVNYTLGGGRLDIQLSGRILPGHEPTWDRVLVAIEDVTEREAALRRQAASENHARGLFQHSPVSLWVEDFRGVKRLIDDVRRRGIDDIDTFMEVHPEFVEQCIAEIVVVDVNQHTLALFRADSVATLLKRLGEVFRDGMFQPFKEQLIDLWNGKLFQQREVVNYALDGTELHLLLQFSVLPGHEADWSLVQVALSDITARKKAEAYLEFLGKHDPLTKVRNRSFYNDEVRRLERKKRHPITVVIADLNGLKEVNDDFGHAAGDALLARAGEVLAKAADVPASVSRIAGDEFAILLPDAGEQEGRALTELIEDLVILNNQYHSAAQLSFSIGRATRHPDESLEDAVRRADLAMYEAKRTFYAGNPKRLSRG